MPRFLKYLQDSYYLFRQHLGGAGIGNSVALPQGYSTKVLASPDDAEIDSLVALYAKAYQKSVSRSQAEVAAMLRRGDVCAAALCNREVVGMTWSGERAAVMDIPFARILKKEEKAALGHHDYVDPEHRGKKLQIAARMEALSHAKQRGCQNYYVFVGVKNEASAHNLMKVFPEFKVVKHIKIDIPFVELNLYPGFHKTRWETAGPP